MGLGAEAFTVLAVIEARDRASEIFEKCGAAAKGFGETTKAVADEAYEAGAKIDEALGRDVSASDRLEVATGRVAAAQAQAKESAAQLTAAENELRDAQASAAAGADDDAAAQGRLVTAAKAVSAAQKDAAVSAKGLKDAEAAQGAALRASAAAGDENAAAQVKAKAAGEESSLTLGKIGKAAGITAIGMGVAAAVMVKAAGNFQDSTAHLQTDAGVTAGNLGMIRANILQVSTATGQSAASITNAMYHIASSGFTGANSLGILKAAAEGARVGGADLDTTSKALVGTMTAYYGTSLSAAQATKDSTSLMNQLIEAVGVGDMRMQDLASSLSTVSPVAAAAGISFAQVGGAIATMTAQGMTARQATQDLANTIRNLKSPNNVASSEMKALGLNANDVSKNLGSKGLAGTLDELRNAVLSNTRGGTVMLGYLKEMSPAAQGLANQIMAGKISTGELTTAMKGLNPQQDALVTKFKAAAVSATGLQQTYTGAMGKMLGGATGLNTALMLTGKHMGDLTANTGKISAESKKASGDVDNWSTIQGTFNFKVAQAKTGIENTGIAIGSALLPAVSAILSAVTKVVIPIAEWTAKHKTLTEILFVGVAALAATVAVVALASKAFKAVKSAVDDVGKAVKGSISLLQKLGILSKKTSDDQAADAQKTAAANEKASADSAAAAETSAGEQEAASGEAAAAAETKAAETATANETAAAESSGSWIASAASTVAGWAAAGARMVAQSVIWVASNTAKVAVVVAENIAGALATAAAWMAANLVMTAGIGLVILAVIAAVVLIIKYWHTIVDGVREAWDAVYDFISGIISKIISFVKSHWPLIVGIFLGPIALVVAEVVKHWQLIEHWFQDGVKAVEKVLSWFTGLSAMFRRWLGEAVSAVVSEGEGIYRWFAGLSAKIRGYILGIPAMLFSSGTHIIESLANGITSAASGALHGAMGFVANTIKSFLPFSPAKQGPLSGAGDPSNSGRSIAKNLARGLTSGTGDVAAASRQLASSVAFGQGGSLTAGIGSSLALSASSAAGGGAGTINLTLDLRGATVANDASMNALASKVGNQVVRQLVASGYKI